MAAPVRVHVALVGLSGVGKSTVAPLLATRRGCVAVDLDRAVELRTGRTVAEVFAADGEEAFRDLESAELARALVGPPSVVATGGGVVLRPSNRALLAEHAVVAWLRAEASELAVRVTRSAQARPLLADDPASTLRRLAAEREALYEQVADIVVDVSGLGPSDVADRLERELQDP
jgi:shikimate kinase